jgi:phosphoglycolate phosphatase-like HAD superfamily hydrolase
MTTNKDRRILIIFDIDGTLTDSVVVHQQAFTESLEELGVVKIDSNYGEYKHHTDSFIAKTIYENYFDKEFDNKILNLFEDKVYNKISKTTIIEIPGAIELLRKLELDPKFDFCFATGSLEKPAIYKLKSLGVSYHSDRLVCSNELYSRDDIVNKALDKSKKHFAQENYYKIVSIGDGLWDLKTANNLGLDFIGIGKKNKRILLDNGCINYIDDLRELELSEL